MIKNDQLSKEKTELKRLTGQIMWVSSQTQSHVVFDVCWMINTGKFPKGKLLSEANKTQQKLTSRTCSITFTQLGRPSDLNIVCHADATYASLEDGSSQGSFYHFCMTNRIGTFFAGHQKTWLGNKKFISLRESCTQWSSWILWINSCHAARDIQITRAAWSPS